MKDEVALSTQIPISEVLAALWSCRLWVAKLSLGALVLGYGFSFLIPSRYRSTTRLMPPDQQLVSSSSMLNMLSGGPPAAFTAAATGGLLSQKTPGAVAIGILSSRTVQDHLVQRFDLQKVYWEKYQENARKVLTKRTSLDEDKKSGILTITVEDRDPTRARDIANAYVQELANVVNNLSTSSARRERIFLEQRIKGVKADLDASSYALSQFSSKNATFDPQKQGQATIEAAAKLGADLIATKSELSSLRTTFTDDNVQVRTVTARLAELQNQLNKLSGTGGSEAGTSSLSSLPSVRQLPLLGYTYYDLYRQMSIQDTLYETLTKQYELAKVQEAKEIAPIKVLDAADYPERRSYPQRVLLAASALSIAFVGAVCWIAGNVFWDLRDPLDPLKATILRIRQPNRETASSAASSTR